MKRVVFAIPVLTAGGAARVVCNLANRFVESPEFSVTVYSHIPGSQYELNDSVEWKTLFTVLELRSAVVNKVWRRLVYWPRLYKSIKNLRADTVISSLTGMNWRLIIVCRMLRVNVIVIEHTNHTAEGGLLNWFTQRWLYKLANKVIVLTPFDLEFYSNYLNNVHRIPNPVSFSALETKPLKQKMILAAGDLNRWHVKGFDLLIDSFSRVSVLHPDWQLCIAGAGESGRRILSELVQKRQLSGKVIFLGFVSDMPTLMASSSIFVVSSRYEGFSMVLLEAMSMGCACVSFDCVSGPAELITQNWNGLLVAPENGEKLADDISVLINDSNMRESMGFNAIARSKEYSIDTIFAQWKALL